MGPDVGAELPVASSLPFLQQNTAAFLNSWISKAGRSWYLFLPLSEAKVLV